MKILKKVSRTEVKRCFVIGDLMAAPPRGKRYLGELTPEAFEKKYLVARKRGLALTVAQLDRRIKRGWHRRLVAYDSSEWYLVQMSPSELGVWKRAGGLPHAWTNQSLRHTAAKVRRALKTNSRQLTRRARRAIPHMLEHNVADLQKEKYLLPIVFKSGHGTRGRHRLKHRVRGDIDDGCMRSIALAVSGARVLRVYFGVPRKKREVH
jgi:hypothetical protein